MKRIPITCLVTTLTLLGIAGTAMADDDSYRSGKNTTPNVNLPVTELKFTDTGVVSKNGMDSLKAAPALGNLATGEHASFVKMPSGFIGAVHLHTYDYYGVVISGVATNASVGEKAIPLPPGSYWFQPGGKPHVTNCISSTECIFFISQKAMFDYVPFTR